MNIFGVKKGIGERMGRGWFPPFRAAYPKMGRVAFFTGAKLNMMQKVSSKSIHLVKF